MISATGNNASLKQRAITFIELLVVIVVIGVLAGVAIPTFRNNFNQLQLDSFSRQLQIFMHYLRQRSVTEGKIIYFNIDNDNRQYWAQMQDSLARLKSQGIPQEIRMESEKKQIIFYPDGSIDKIDILISAGDSKNITLTTKGVFGGVKLKVPE